MNLFFLSEDPQTAASYHIDRHVVKMPLETSQMLFHAGEAMIPDFKQKYLSISKTKIFYVLSKPHQYHPCTVWLKSSTWNFIWGMQLFNALIREKKLRYPDSTKTALYKVNDEFNNYFRMFLPDIDLNDYIHKKISFPAQAFGKNYKHLVRKYDPQKPHVDNIERAICAYRDYYFQAKKTDKNDKPMAFWKLRGAPYWWKERLNNVFVQR